MGSRRPPILHRQSWGKTKTISGRNSRREAQVGLRSPSFSAAQCCRPLIGEGSSRTFQIPRMSLSQLASSLSLSDPVFLVSSIRCLKMIDSAA